MEGFRKCEGVGTGNDNELIRFVLKGDLFEGDATARLLCKELNEISVTVASVPVLCIAQLRPWYTWELHSDDI